MSLTIDARVGLENSWEGRSDYRRDRVAYVTISFYLFAVVSIVGVRVGWAPQ